MVGVDSFTIVFLKFAYNIVTSQEIRQSQSNVSVFI